MRRQRFARFLNPFDYRVAEFLVSKMVAHEIDNALPVTLAAFFVDRFVPHDGELVGARRHENEDSVAFGRLVHAEAIEFFLRGVERIGI